MTTLKKLLMVGGSVLMMASDPQNGSGCGGGGGCGAPPPSDPPATVLLTVSSDSSLGSVTSDPAGIACGTSCSTPVPPGTSVTLTATPVDGTNATFLGWDGPCSGTQPTCTVTVNESTTVTAKWMPQAQPDMAAQPDLAPPPECLQNSDCKSGVCSSSKCVTKQSCAQIKQANATAPSGVYQIDPVQNGASTPFSAYCDMTNEGGGWTLVLAYNHAGGTNLPLAEGTRPIDPQGGFSHYSPAQLSQAVFSEIRFYCKTSAHSRIMHFKTSNAGAIAYLKVAGGNNTSYWNTGFTALTGHTANLPGATTDISNFTATPITDFPFWKNSTYHWGVRGNLYRWECDDYPNDSSATTLHQVWIR